MSGQGIVRDPDPEMEDTVFLEDEEEIATMSLHVSIRDTAFAETSEGDVACPFDEPPEWT